MSETGTHRDPSPGPFPVAAHLVDDAFASDLDDVLRNARAVNVARIVTVPETLEESERVLALAQRHAGMISPCAGLHPVQHYRSHEGEVLPRSVRHDEVDPILAFIRGASVNFLRDDSTDMSARGEEPMPR